MELKRYKALQSYRLIWMLHVMTYNLDPRRIDKNVRIIPLSRDPFLSCGMMMIDSYSYPSFKR